MEQALSFYYIAYDKIYSHAADMHISTQDAKKAIGYTYRLPKPYIQVILKEIEALGWIEWENRDLIKLNREPISILKNRARIHNSLGLWV